MWLDKLKIKDFWPYYVIAIVSFVTICFWFKGGGLLFFADGTFPIVPKTSLHTSFFSWRSDISGGIADTTGHAILPLFLFLSFFEYLHFNIVASQAILFFILLFGSGINTYFLLKYISEKNKFNVNKFTLLVPSIFFISNLYIALNGWRSLIFLYIFYAFLPLLVLLFIKYLDSDKKKYIIYFSLLTSLIVSVALTNISYLIVLGIILLIYVLTLREKRYIQTAKSLILAICIWLPLNIWYLLPQFFNISGGASRATSNSLQGSISILDVISSHASILNVLTINGFYSLYDKLGGKWFTWTFLYTDSLFRILTLIFPLALALVIFNSNKIILKNRYYLYSLFLIISGTLMAKGSHEPFGFIYKYLLLNFPVPFLALRAAYEKLDIIVVFGYVLILFFFYKIYERKFKNSLVIASTIIIAILGFPIFTGEIFNSNNGIRPSASIHIPIDYYEVAQILRSDPQSLTLSLPMQPTAWISSKWNEGKDGYLGNDILRLISNTPIVSTLIGDPEADTFNQIVEMDFNRNPIPLGNLIARNAKYILVRKDINYEWAEAYGKAMIPIDTLISNLSSTTNFSKVYESNNLILFKTQGTPRSYIDTTSLIFNINDSKTFNDSYNFITSSLHKQFNFTVNSNKNLFQININHLFGELNKQNINTANGMASTPSSFRAENNNILYHVKNSTNSLLQSQFSTSTLNANTILRYDKSQNTFIYSSQAPFKNLINNFSFETGLWKNKVDDCSASDSESQIEMTLNDHVSSEGQKSLQLETQNHSACTSIIIPVKSNSKYLLSFDYQSPNSPVAGYYIQFNSSNNNAISEKIDVLNTNWNTFNKIFLTPSNTTQIKLFVYSYPQNSEVKTINHYDNFYLTEVPEDINNYWLVSDPQTNFVNPQNITFDLNSPTKKTVHITGATTPFYLSMSESYHDQWQLEMNNSKIHGALASWTPWTHPDMVPNSQHFKLDDFLNDWYVDVNELCKTKNLCTQNADGSYNMEMVIEFWPQRWFYVGLIISGTTFAGVIGYFVYDVVRRRRNRRNMNRNHFDSDTFKKIDTI